MLYQGDDLINLLTVTIRGEDGTLPTIDRVDLKIGTLIKKFESPTNPFTVNVMRDESIKLSTKNNVYAAIWYHTMVDGEDTLVKKTCEGTLVINTNPEVISDGRCKC